MTLKFSPGHLGRGGELLFSLIRGTVCRACGKAIDGPHNTRRCEECRAAHRLDYGKKMRVKLKKRAARTA